MYTLTNKRAISFYERHKNLDFNSVNELFVDIIEKLFDNISNQHDNKNSYSLMQELSQKVSHIQEQFSSQNALLKEISSNIHQDISGLISTHQTSLTNLLRDTMKSNYSDSEKTIIGHISQNNELFLSKINSITNNESIRTFFSKELSSLRTGRANAAMLDLVKVDVYGQQMPINQIGSITTPEPRMINIQVWDTNNVPLLDAAIKKSDLGLNPQAESRCDLEQFFEDIICRAEGKEN